MLRPLAPTLCFIAFGFPTTAWTTPAIAQKPAELDQLINQHCIGCHDADTETDVDLSKLHYGAASGGQGDWKKWEKVFDRVTQGEMPPPSEDRPDAKLLETVLNELKQTLHQRSLERQKESGRVRIRRLTKLELGYTLQDLLKIQGEVTRSVPDEPESGSFDTIGANQRISAVHLESYLQAADEALALAIRLGRNPKKSIKNDFAFLKDWHENPLNLGGSITRELDPGPGVALFRDVDYLTQFTYDISAPGIYQLKTELSALQSKTPVTAKFIVKDQSGGATLVHSVDLLPDEDKRVIEVESFLRPGEVPYLTFDSEGNEPFVAIMASGGSKNYQGRGLAIHSQEIIGPITATWPPPSTETVFTGIKLQKTLFGGYKLNLASDKKQQLRSLVLEIAPRVFRREVELAEIEPFVNLADSAIEEGRPFDQLVRVPLRSMLSSPQFLFFDGQPGRLNDYQLANRLSYFLWKSLPDAELMMLAESQELSKSSVLTAQVERMLEDPKSERFVRDFLGQWLRLYEVNATSPDEKLYPEFDELLANAIPKEPQYFFSELIRENLSIANLVDSDFTFVNRRLAKHYKIPEIKGQNFQRVALDESSIRGGLLTQAAILKTTANGTTTSPVMRGNFVLTNLLGTPPSPPPPGIGSIEPDTRGKTTIRKILAAHREDESCNQCHKEIDPPGFALESFDPIGGFRQRYRSSGQANFLANMFAPAVDASGVTSGGQKFSGIEEFKAILLQDKKQIAKNFVQQLVAYSTGAEVQFADREVIQEILDVSREDGYPIRDLIHSVVQSRIFREQ
ncbi:MAG: DUF1592 domain-containing protein [Planctomycetota bacterium]